MGPSVKSHILPLSHFNPDNSGTGTRGRNSGNSGTDGTFSDICFTKLAWLIRETSRLSPSVVLLRVIYDVFRSLIKFVVRYDLWIVERTAKSFKCFDLARVLKATQASNYDNPFGCYGVDALL